MLDIERIKEDYGYALRSECSENKCSLMLDGLSNHIVLKGDAISQDVKMCDCIIFVVDGSTIIGIVELKSKSPDSSEIVEKFNRSTETALAIFEKYGDRRTEFRFCYLALARKWKTPELNHIKRNKITVKGKQYSINTKRCGVSFSDVIKG